MRTPQTPARTPQTPARAAAAAAATLLLLAATMPCPAQELVYAEGSDASTLTLRALDETAPRTAPTVLRTELEFLPIEITNRTAQQALRTDVSRLAVRRGLRRVELPDGGALYAYRLRGGQRYGFLHVAPDGATTFLLEQNGSGIGGRSDPFAGRIGVAPDGRHAAVATVAGRVFVVKLDGSTYASTGTAWRDTGLPIDVDAATLSPGTNVLFCGTESDRAFRVPFADGTVPVDVTPGGVVNPNLKDEFCLSDDGRVCAFLYGPRDSWSIFVVGETLPALRLPPPPAKYEEPGYLPDEVGGPRMMLSHDGTRLLYTDATSRDEIFWLDTTGASLTTHVTSDQNFEPYIGIGVIPLAMASSVVIGVGDIAAFDVYAASTATSVVTNLTQTNGNTTLPFAVGSLVPHNAAALTDGSVLTDLTNAGRRELWRVAAGASRTVVSGVTAALDRGRGLGASADYRAASSQGDRLLSAADASTLLWAPPGIALSNTVTAPGDAFRVLTASVPGAAAIVLRFGDGSVVAIDAGGPVGDVVLTGRGLAVDGAALQYLFPPGGAVTLPTSGPLRWVLSGAGTAP